MHDVPSDGIQYCIPMEGMMLLQIYVIKAGDTLYQIARRFQTPMEELVYLNQLRAPGTLCVGQALVLPDLGAHVVREGETLTEIADRYALSQQSLIAANPQLRDPDRLAVGTALTIPGGTDPTGTIGVNGYASRITEQTLAASVPSLSLLSVFSWRAQPDGTLEPDYEVPLETVRDRGVCLLMTVTNLRAKGGFSPELAHTILRDSGVQTRLISAILAELERQRLDGVNLDFEYVPPEDRQQYNDFLTTLSGTLHGRGYLLATALAPKRSDGQKGLLYEAHDYAAHGQAADYTVLMTYEWGYTYGPPMAVAPLDRVRAVLDYAVTRIPREKILMGIPNYGYDWTLPYEKTRAARALTNVQAVTLAGEQKAAIEFDETAQAPFYHYTEDGVSHVVWFEDARSLEAKMKTAGEYGLGGVSFWSLNNLFRTNFLVLDSLYRVEQRCGQETENAENASLQIEAEGIE